ncbi:MAG: DUF4116 domain-containing protein [Betaproteobacteria bacterium]
MEEFELLSLLEELRWDEEKFSPQMGKFTEDFYTNRDLIRLVLMTNGSCLKYLSKQFSSDPELVLTAGFKGFEYASEDLKSNRSFLLLMVDKEGPYVLRYAHKSVLLDEEFLKGFKLADLSVLIEFGPDELKTNRDFVKEVIARNGYDIRHLSDEFKNDFEIALLAVSNNEHAYEFISDEMKANKKIFLAGPGGAHLEHAPDVIRSDLECLRHAVSRFGGALAFVKDETLITPDLILLAAYSRSNVEEAYRSIPSNLRSNRSLAIQLVANDAAAFDYMDVSLQEDAYLKLLRKVYLL